jgi:UDP-GlcNAc:undecaprenyl-phosphate GlcNAc-1-phosphate transferase
LTFTQTPWFFLILFIIAAGVSYVLNGSIRSLYLKKGYVDQINERSSHTALVTRSGGVALFLALVLAISATAAMYPVYQESAFWLALVLIFITGLWDDLYNLTFKQKFIVQVAVGLLLTQTGYMINSFHGVFGLYELPYLASLCVSLAVYIIVVNSMNLIDGIDGLASLIFSLFLGLMGILFWSAAPELFVMVPVILGVLLAFLNYNISRVRKIFLGDSGSLLLGTLMSFMLFWLLDHGTNVATDLIINRGYLSVVLLIYPLTDTLRVFILRVRMGKSPFTADRLHLHHKLIDRGFTHFFAALLVAFLSFLFLSINLIWYGYLGFYGSALFSITLMILVYYAIFKK